MKNQTVQSLNKTALAAALLLELSAGAHAATINVDNSSCTLSAAITAANTDTATAGCTAGSGDDVIELPAESTITLNTELPAIINNLTINANGSSITRNNSATNDFSIISGGQLGVLPKITINDAQISGGINAYNNGGGINLFAASLVLNRSTVTDNTGGGVAVVLGPDSKVNNSHIFNNITAVGYDSNYYGGGLAVSGGNMLIENSTIANNQASSASLQGGGLYLTSYRGATSVEVINSTISGNSSTLNGGGVALYKSIDSELVVSFIHTTIINNSSTNGGGIFNDEAMLTINASLLAGNTATMGGNNVKSTNTSVTTSNYNLFGYNSDAGLQGVTLGGNDIVPVTANLSEIIDTALANNGGTTPTHNLPENSLAVDAIVLGNCTVAFDQVGFIRGNDGNGDTLNGCDLGALEFQPILVDLIFYNGFEPTKN